LPANPSTIIHNEWAIASENDLKDNGKNEIHLLCCNKKCTYNHEPICRDKLFNKPVKTASLKVTEKLLFCSNDGNYHLNASTTNYNTN